MRGRFRLPAERLFKDYARAIPSEKPRLMRIKAGVCGNARHGWMKAARAIRSYPNCRMSGVGTRRFSTGFCTRNVPATRFRRYRPFSGKPFSNHASSFCRVLYPLLLKEPAQRFEKIGCSGTANIRSGREPRLRKVWASSCSPRMAS
jgi:hypothetical protein